MDNGIDSQEFSLSLVMALHNGAQFIRRQANSIVKSIPLELPLQVVLVDDHSCDDSVDIAVSCFSCLNNCEILVIRNLENIGPFLSFFEGIKHCKGSVIFLSDQDDEWYEEKTIKILDAFTENKNVQLVCHSARVHRGDDKQLSLYPTVRYGEMFVLGCCLAFRSIYSADLTQRYEEVCSILGYPLGHDRFICFYFNSFGSTLLMEKKLITYYIHGDNYSCRRKTKRPFLISMVEKAIERSALYRVFKFSELEGFQLKFKKVVFSVTDRLLSRR